MGVEEPAFKRRKTARFELLEELGRGGMGVIHRARDRVANRDVAFKRMLLKPGRTQARMLALFQREYETLSQLRHPNIIDVYDYGVDAEGPYYVMELLAGDDLSVRAPMPVREACVVLRDVASALALVHARKLIHRDLSPNNVRLDKDGRAKLFDFGGLCAFGVPTELVGTPPFIAPECLTGHPLDQRCDLYALGAIAYALLTNRAAVVASSIAELAAAWERTVIDPSTFVTDLPPSLRDLIMSMLAIDPLERPDSAAYVIERLTSIADLPPPPEERQQALSFLARPPLVGRDAVMAPLEQALTDACEGRGGVVLIEASGGLGRTVLLDAIALEARRRATLVLSVAHEQRSQPFGVARRLYQAVTLAHPELSPDAHHSPDSILSNAPRSAEARAPSNVDAAERQTAVIENVLRLLREASALLPVVIVVDDLHAVDSESMAMLGALAAEAEERALLLLASVRPDLIGPQDHAAYARLGVNAQRIGLSPLTDAQMSQLVASVFGGAANGHRVADFLQAQSGGNPATALDLARHLLARGIIQYARGAFALPHDIDIDVDVGSGLSDLALARVGDLPMEASQVVEALALHDGALALEELAVATALDLPTVQHGVDELMARGVVASLPEGLTLASSTLRSALTRQLDIARRTRLHERLADALVAGAGDQLDRRFRACDHLLRAGHEAAAAALVEAIPVEDLLSSLLVQWVPLLESVLAVYQKTGRSTERCLSLMLPIAHAGYFGDLKAQMRQVEDALPAMSKVCGIALAVRLRKFLGGRLALVSGLLYAAVRRGFTKREERLGSLPMMLAHFVALVCGASAAAVTAFRPSTARRFNTWLDPFSVLPRGEAVPLMREFCIATTEVGEGAFRSAIKRYTELVALLAKPVRNLPDRLREQIYLGCLHGLAQSKVIDADPAALAYADELSEKSLFFAPHAEIVRAGYHCYRGEQASAEQHRARAELLALRSGVTWSVATLAAGRRAHGAMLARDPVALSAAISELSRLSDISDALSTFHTFCCGYLAHLRGRTDEALAIIEPLMTLRAVRGIGPWRFHAAIWAELQIAAGRHQHAHDYCVATLADPSEDASATLPALLINVQLALAEASLGALPGALARLSAQAELPVAADNPLARGAIFHARARLAILARDALEFDAAYAAACDALRATGAPSLLHSCDALLVEAISAGVRTKPIETPRSDLPPDTLDGSTYIKHSQFG